MNQPAVATAKKSGDFQLRPDLDRVIIAGMKNIQMVSRAGVKTSPPISI
jgi:hypothetical protein